MKQPSSNLLPSRSVPLPARSPLIHYAARLSRLLLAITLILAGAAAVSAQSYYDYPESTPVSGGGTLNYTLEVQNGWCGGPQVDADVFENFSFTPSGGAPTNLGGYIDYVFPCGYYGINGGWDYIDNNDSSDDWSSQLNLSYGNCTISFDAYMGGGGNASMYCPPSIQGYVNPKYVVVGVTYAPPGSSSSVDYTQTTSVGNTTKISSSFQDDVGYSVSLSGNAKIPAAFIVGGNVKLTFTESTDYTQGSNSSVETTFSKENTVSYLTPGTPTLSPVDHDRDFIWIWVNPELLTTLTPNGDNPAQLQLTGYAFDPHDPVSGMPPPTGPYVSGPDIVEVQVGCLNGDISCPSTLTWLNGVEGPGSYVNSGPFARSWAASADGYPYDFPAGELPNLTFDDVCNILTFDPLASTPSQCSTQNNYTLLNSLPSGTTSDGRFTKAPYPPNVIQYPVGAPTEQYDVKQINTQSVAQGTSNEIKQVFSVSEEFSTNFLGFWKSTVDMKESQTLTWDYAWLDTLTQSTTLTNALSITGPPDPPPTYYGPVQFVVYQDNMFGTYVFIPD